MKKKIVLVESQEEYARYIFALHLAKNLASMKMNILILDTNQISNFLDFPKIVCSMKNILSEEPYKIKISTITNRTDLLKLPNELFLDSIDDKLILNKFQILLDYFIEKYDFIICPSFITDNHLIKLLIDNATFIFDIKKITEINEKEIIQKSKIIANPAIEYKILLEAYDKQDHLNMKNFLKYKKIFENSLINQTVFLEKNNEGISFINQKVYNKQTLNEINEIILDINFYKNRI
ncbi:MAG: hypothetical protein ACRCVI_01155 [Mycoplasmoidaceae bacterium]